MCQPEWPRHISQTANHRSAYMCHSRYEFATSPFLGTNHVILYFLFHSFIWGRVSTDQDSRSLETLQEDPKSMKSPTAVLQWCYRRPQIYQINTYRPRCVSTFTFLNLLLKSIICHDANTPFGLWSGFRDHHKVIKPKKAMLAQYFFPFPLQVSDINFQIIGKWDASQLEE